MKKIPDVDIIDLEDSDSEEALNEELTDWNPDVEEIYKDEFDEDEPEESERPPKRFRVNMHIVLLVAVLIFIAGLVYKFFNWGEYVDLDEIFKDGQGTYEDTYDEFLPLTNEAGDILPLDYSDGLTIVAFGNAPFADDRDSDDNLLNLIAKETDATVYNCSISGSYMAAQLRDFNADKEPMDAYTFYWLATIACGTDLKGHFTNAEKNLGDATPADAWDAYNTLTSIDFNEVDVITVMYDATDYLLGHNMYNFENATDPTHFAGNLEAGIEILQAAYPHIRIIVMGPTYAYAIDENGDYISSDIQRYGEQDVLSVYSIMEWSSCASRSVTFVDHLYGTITEDNAKHYLEDNLHLNKAGRKKVAGRFVDALTHFDDRTTE